MSEEEIKTAIFTKTREVFVNGIKITSSEDWDKVLKSLIELQQELAEEKRYIGDLEIENKELKEKVGM